MVRGIYRVRRRKRDGSGDQDLVQHFHDMQERIAYYEGWLGMESPVLGRAYRRFLSEVMEEAKTLIQEAWSRPGCPPTEQTDPDEKGPSLADAKQRFLLDVREHLSRWFWVRGRLRGREKRAERSAKRAGKQRQNHHEGSGTDEAE